MKIRKWQVSVSSPLTTRSKVGEVMVAKLAVVTGVLMALEKNT